MHNNSGNTAPEQPHCQHTHFRLNATGIDEDFEAQTVTVTTHWWCDDCDCGFSDTHTYRQDEIGLHDE